MPLRALGYIASAITLASAHLPKAQVQMVHTLNAGHRINGIDTSAAAEQARRLASMSGRVIGRQTVTHLVDPDIEPAIDSRAMAEALRTVPEKVSEKLGTYAIGKGDMLQYIAAHLHMHDTDVELSPLTDDDQAPVPPARIISIGSQSERPFYLARMACRQQGVAIPGLVEETAQLFTKHVLPPYKMCREGEPHIDELDMTYPLRHFLEWGYDPLYEREHQNPSVRRDLSHIADFLAVREDPMIRDLQDITAHIQGGGLK